MGTKHQVWVWVEGKDGEFHYAEAYAGEWLIAALWCAWDLKRWGSGCVKIEWR